MVVTVVLLKLQKTNKTNMKTTEDINKEIQSLIDVYNFDIIKLKEYFKDSCSTITLTEILVLKRVVTNLEKLI